MSSRNFLVLLTVFAPICTGLHSCAKKEAPATPYTRIQGTWKLAQTATDDNNDGAIQESEKHIVPTAQDYEITFNKDYTGSEHDVYGSDTSILLRFGWALSKNNVWVGYDLHDTVNYDLVNLSANNLTLQYPTTSGIAWFSYNKK